MSILWFILGAAAAVLCGLSIGWTVGGLNLHGARPRAIAVVAGGAVLRIAAAALVLAVALRQGIAEGLLAFGGLWLGRWAAVAILTRRDKSVHARVPSHMESS